VQLREPPAFGCDERLVEAARDPGIALVSVAADGDQMHDGKDVGVLTILRSAVSDAASNLLDFIPSLGTGEAFVFGEGVALPTQLQFAKLPEQRRPRNEALADRRMAGGAVDLDFIASVVERWRGTMASNRFRPKGSPALPGASGIASNANSHGKFELHYK
jgi:hypothetical protein